MTLEDRLAELVAEATDVRTTDKNEYSRSGTVFAVHPSADVIELRLGPDIAEAARRTPDTAASARGATASWSCSGVPSSKVSETAHRVPAELFVLPEGAHGLGCGDATDRSATLDIDLERENNT